MFQMQVGKAYFELVDYLEADRAFSLARQASPYSLEGMDIYSTVLYVSFDHIVLEERILFYPVKWKGGCPNSKRMQSENLLPWEQGALNHCSAS